jgi:perosamine synthetase
MHSSSGQNSHSLKTRFIPFHKPSISEEEIAAVVEALESGWLTTGPRVKEFEAAFAEATGARHAIAVSSCTAALHLALEAVGTKPGDVVITSPMTFAATAEVVRYFDATPVFVDIEPETMNIDVGKMEKEIEARLAAGQKVRAIIPVHFAGHPCRMDEIMSVARRHGIRVVEDAAHAFPAAYGSVPVGRIGDITTFSFYATKTITTGEGGMVTTDDDAYAERMRIMSLHGISADAWNRYSEVGNWYYEVLAPGFKYNLTDIAASLGIVQLRRAESLRERRDQIRRRYDLAFAGNECLQTPVALAGIKHSWHLYVIRLGLASLTCGRNEFITRLKEKGIGTSVHFIPLHIHPYYREKYGYRPEDMPVAWETYQKSVSLPIYPEMSDEDVERVIECVHETLRDARR